MAPGPLNYASAHENKQEEKALRELRLDGSVVLKIVKHCQESQPFLVTGQLLGLDIGSSLEVTDCFPFPVSPYLQHTILEFEDHGRHPIHFGSQFIAKCIGMIITTLAHLAWHFYGCVPHKSA